MRQLKSEMNDRERFRQTMAFGQPDRVPLWECAFWGETLERWLGEGLPLEVVYPAGPGSYATEDSMRQYFGFDRSSGVHFRDTVRVNLGMCPGFNPQILAEENGLITELGRDGVISRWSKTSHSTRQYICFPVENRTDFQNLKKQFDPDSAGRYATGWLERVHELQAKGAPVCIAAGGYYGFARELMGLENLSYALCDDIALIEDIFEFRTEYVSRILEKVLQFITPDFAEFWEDMAYKTGPLLSPQLFRKIALKHYRQITGLLGRYGVKTILLDSDGNVDKLIPIWLDGGINAIWPMEIAADMDLVSIRRKYGHALALIGGIDKRALAAGKTAIHAEVMAKVPYLLETGGYIPTCDHAVPPNATLSDYLYYLDLIRSFFV